MNRLHLDFGNFTAGGESRTPTSRTAAPMRAYVVLAMLEGNIVMPWHGHGYWLSQEEFLAAYRRPETFFRSWLRPRLPEGSGPFMTTEGLLYGVSRVGGWPWAEPPRFLALLPD